MQDGKSCAMCRYFEYGRHSNYDDFEIIHTYDGYCKNGNNDVSEYQAMSVKFNDYCPLFVDKYEQPKKVIDQCQKTFDNLGVNVEKEIS